MRILLTGGTGFIGQALLKLLSRNPAQCRAVTRYPLEAYQDSNNIEQMIIDSIDAVTDWSAALNGVEIVIHLAALKHIKSNTSNNSLIEYKKTNTDGTLNLARKAVKAGVKRFIFVSTIKIHGETTTGLPAYSEKSAPDPQDPYSISKWEAETGLQHIANETSMEVVIIRSPLVYGPGVKANFYCLMKLADSPLPLPSSAVHNSRSMMYVGNLADFISRCIDHPAAANQTFLVSDNNDLSLTSLVRLLRTSLGRSIRLLPVPSYLFRAIAILVGKRKLVEKLIGDLRVDPAKATDLLGWQPPYSVEQGIQATVAAYSLGKK